MPVGTVSSETRRLAAVRAAATATLGVAGVTDCAGLEADVLLGHVTGYGRAHLIAHGEELLPAGTVHALDALVARRSAGEPVAYLVEAREFYGLELRVTPATLIPRPDSETLLEVARRSCAGTPPVRILDLGTGSGCLALALATLFPAARVWATDASAGARTVAAANVSRHGCSDRVDVLAHAFGAPLPPSVAVPVDLVVCNPPYLREEEWRQAARDVRDYEPRDALVAGPDGLLHYPAVIRTAVAALRPAGRLLLEIGADQAAAVQALLSPRDWGRPTVHCDLAGRARVVEAIRAT